MVKTLASMGGLLEQRMKLNNEFFREKEGLHAPHFVTCGDNHHRVHDSCFEHSMFFVLQMPSNRRELVSCVHFGNAPTPIQHQPQATEETRQDMREAHLRWQAEKAAGTFKLKHVPTEAQIAQMTNTRRANSGCKTCRIVLWSGGWMV
jgi:hypothetical protein